MDKRVVISEVSLAARQMKNLLGVCTLALVTSAIVVGMSFAGSTMALMGKTVPEFEKMKSLVGEWQGKSLDGATAKVTYTLVSDNSALMEKLVMGGESEMVTMYHPDGDHLMMTHYCSAHNQPRMRTQKGSMEITNIIFDLVDVTNLLAPDAGHMKKLVLTFTDQDHFTQEWTWREKGKESAVVIRFERKK
jgi:hypothetical protein